MQRDDPAVLADLAVAREPQLVVRRVSTRAVPRRLRRRLHDVAGHRAAGEPGPAFRPRVHRWARGHDATGRLHGRRGGQHRAGTSARHHRPTHAGPLQAAVGRLERRSWRCSASVTTSGAPGTTSVRWATWASGHARGVASHTPDVAARDAVGHVLGAADGYCCTRPDVLDPAEFASQGVPGVPDTPGGLTWDQLRAELTTAVSVVPARTEHRRSTIPTRTATATMRHRSWPPWRHWRRRSPTTARHRGGEVQPEQTLAA